IVAYEMARQLGARAVFAERQDGRLTLRRGFRIQPGERCLVVEDVVTTGGSVREVLEVARQAGADVVGVAVLADRSGGRALDLGVRVEYLLSLDAPAWDPDDCPLCRAGVPLEKRGSRDLARVDPSRNWANSASLSSCAATSGGVQGSWPASATTPRCWPARRGTGPCSPPTSWWKGPISSPTPLRTPWGAKRWPPT